MTKCPDYDRYCPPGWERVLQSAAFNPDGTRIVTASYDGTARVWRPDGTGPPVVLRGHENRVYSAVFSSDGTYIVTASSDRTARVWPIDTDFLAKTACAYAGRNFTRAEWSEIFPDTQYRKTCPQWPEAPPDQP